MVDEQAKASFVAFSETEPHINRSPRWMTHSIPLRPFANAASNDEVSTKSATHVAIVGAGAMSTYILHALMAHDLDLRVTVFESGDTPGPGLAYSAKYNDVHALANIAGVEIPPLCQSLNAWLVQQDEAILRRWGVAESAGDDRAFFPRQVLGAWLSDQFDQLCVRHADRLAVRRNCDVFDIEVTADGCRIDWSGPDGHVTSSRFDMAIVATGYGAMRDDRAKAGALTGTMPVGANGRTGVRFGILGTSLSGIDAVVGLAASNGAFVRSGDQLQYVMDRPWHATLMSRNGILPEADFWFPVPTAPLEIFTQAGAEQLAKGQDGDLDLLFALFLRQLEHGAPDRMAADSIGALSVENFAGHYFADRLVRPPFEYARDNLVEAKASHARRRTDPWRMTVLQSHEVFGAILPRLSRLDQQRFRDHLQRVFVDSYAAVPHLSIERLLALDQAGVLDIVALGSTYRLLPENDRQWRVAADHWHGAFDEMIDARGQQVAPLQNFPFPTLRLQLCAAALSHRQDWRDGIATGIDLLASGYTNPAFRRVYFCVLPFLLGQRPFAQGLVECARMADTVASSIAQSVLDPEPLSSVDGLLAAFDDAPTMIFTNGSVITG